MTEKQIEIIKANGEREMFVPMKLENSLLRSGAEPELVEEVIAHIREELNDGMTTKEIYKHAFEVLARKKKSVASRYSLRNAVIGMGPTGFPFEQFVARIFTEKGYQTHTGVIMRGKCGEHEIDVIAHTNDSLIMMEAKFHNEHGISSGIKTALYVKARFEDLKDQPIPGIEGRTLDQGWLVTNTKFTSSAIEYGACAGLSMVGWNYPATGNLQDLIEESGLHPITCLTSLTDTAKRSLLENNTVLCRMVKDDDELLRAAGLTTAEITEVREEAGELCI
ncbi:MAG: ATP cone domain-containing protein [Candidatus Paceibacterota bacterium]